VGAARCVGNYAWIGVFLQPCGWRLGEVGAVIRLRRPGIRGTHAKRFES